MSSSSRLRRQRAAANITAAPRRPAAPRTAPTLGQKLRYAFDASMARGTSALLAYLGFAVLVMVVLTAAAALILGVGPTTNPITAAYNALLHTIDSGTVANDNGTDYRVIGVIVTFGGIVVFSAFIGVLATGLDERLAELRKGRSQVLERDHTLILGWSDTIFTILSELSIANESERNPVVVVLADRDKVEMEDAIRERVPDMRNTKVVCRTGSPIDLRDLAIANHHDCRSIIVLSPDEEDPDTSVIKTILALTRGPDRRHDDYRIVAEIENPANLEAAHMVGGGEAVLVDKGETIARLIVQTSRQAGAAAVYVELMDFDGDEIYFRADASLSGKTYGDAVLAYENCSVIGVKDAEGVHINPSADRVIGAEDEIVAVAEDDSVLEIAQPCRAIPDASRISAGVDGRQAPIRALLVGVNHRTAAVLRQLDEFVSPGSHALVLGGDADRAAHVVRHAGQLENMAVEVRSGNTTDRATLEGIGVGTLDSIIVMAEEGLSPQRADARTLVTLLHLRELTADAGHHVTIASEMLDEGNRELAQVTEVDDVIVSDQIVSLMLAQISENPDLAEVFEELLGSEGSEVYLRDAADYVTPGEPVSFATLVVSASRRGETAIGYRDAETGEVRVNIAKSQLFACAAGDKLVVLDED